MKVDAMLTARPLADAQALARDAATAGFSGLVVTEAGRTAYLSCAAAALASNLHLSTGIAVAFPRSPMVTAQCAWELTEATGGRFRLGLGAQVRAHSERRYAAPFDPPGPRLREYVEAVRACFRAFAGEERLSFAGRYYNLSLLPDQWSPGPMDHPPPPIDVAAVNPWMLRMASEVADGVHVHPLNTPAYLAETVHPNAGDIDLLVPCFAAPGDTEEERRSWRDIARLQVAFYGSTPNYAFIFEQVGHPDVTPRLREHQKARDIPGMAAVVTDEVLEHFVVESPWDDLADGLIERYGGIATRLIVYFAGLAWERDRSSLGRWGEVARDVVARTPGPPAPDADASDPEEL